MIERTMSPEKLDLLTQQYAGKRIVTVACDLADRYISTALFSS